jgi:hypothetical protein
MPHDATLAPVFAILAIVAIAATIIVVRRFIPVRRDIEPEDLGLAPLPPLPSDPLAEPPALALPSTEPPPAAEPTPAPLSESPPAPLDAPAACRVCGDALTHAELIEHEDWAQVQSGWGRILARLGMRLAMAPGRELFAAHGLCRSCAAIGDHEDQLEAARLAALVAAKRRVWEREGRDAAIRRRIEAEQAEHAELLRELARSDTRLHLRGRID